MDGGIWAKVQKHCKTETRAIKATHIEDSLYYQISDGEPVPWRVVKEVISTSAVVDEDHEGNGETSKGVKAFDAALFLLGAFFKLSAENEDVDVT